jgi:aspartate carbamoyltransferase regulatory subunit
MGVIAVISPSATINWIVDGKLSRKTHPVPVPDELGDILLCSNAKCTTNTEGGSRRFKVLQQPTDTDPFRVLCRYCEKEFYGPLVRFYTGQTLKDVRRGRFEFRR